MHELRYEAASGAVIELEDVRSALAGQALDLRGSEWSYTLAQSSAYGMTRRARAVKVDVAFTRLAAANEASDAFDADVAAGTPGTLVADGTWRQRAYVLAADPQRASLRDCELRLTVALLDGRWHSEVTVDVTMNARNVDGLDFPLGFPLDLGYESKATPVRLVTRRRALVGVTLYGPCTDPSVSLIGEDGVARHYGVTGEVAYGCTATIDPLASGMGRTVYVTDAVGGTATAFSRRTTDALVALPPGRYAIVADDCQATVRLMELNGGVPWS